MAHMFLEEDQVKEIIERLYYRNYTAGLICELCYLRNFRVGDVRFALVRDFRKDNGYPEIFLRTNKTKDDWYPIPNDIYNKIMKHIKEEKLKQNDNAFKIHMVQKGRYYLNEAVITHEWIIKLWYSICKKLDIYTENQVPRRHCDICKYALPKKKCKVYGNVKRRASIHIKQCQTKGKIFMQMERHPRLHEVLRGSGAQNKVKYYMDQGKSYEESLLIVFHMSNWKSYKVFKTYLDSMFEKEVGDRVFVNDWMNTKLI